MFPGNVVGFEGMLVFISLVSNLINLTFFPVSIISGEVDVFWPRNGGFCAACE